MADSPEIEKTDTEVVIKFPKHSDLDIKFYNPEIFHSLGFKNVTIHLDTLESGNMYGGGLLDYEPTPEQPIETLSYPYRYFAYMFRAFNPSAKSDVQTKPSAPKGLISSIMGLADNARPSGEMVVDLSSNNNKPQLTESKDKEEVEKENGFFSMFVNKNKQPATATDKKEPSIIDSLFPAEKTPIEQKEPSIIDSLFPAAEKTPTPAAVEEKTPEQKEPSIMDSLFPAAEKTPTPATVEEKTPEQKEPSIMDSLFPAAEKTPTPATVGVEEKTPEQKEPSIMDSLFPAAEKTPTATADNQGVATMNEVTPDAVVTSLPATEPEPAPVIPFAPITTPFSAKWVIHVPIVDNNTQDAGEEDMPTKDNESFDDVLLFSELEAKNGIYVRGNFIDVLGHKIKIGSVEQLGSGENMRTVKEYLSGRPLLEGTRMQKYSILFSN